MNTYVIIPVAFAQDPDVIAACAKNLNGPRMNLAGTHAMMKWSGVPTPKAITDLGDIPHYSNKAILEILRGPEWTDPEVMP